MTAGFTCPGCKAVMKSQRRYERHVATRCAALKAAVTAAREALHPKRSSKEVRRQQRDAAVQGKRWVVLPCALCGAEVPIHVDWRAPLILCKDCRAKRKEWLLTVHARSYAAKVLRPRMPTEGWVVGGGLPSLGKRR